MKHLISFCIAVLIAVVLLNFLPVSGESEIYSNTVRLHILANSDSAEDQEIKFKLRDVILVKLKEILKDVSTIEEALNLTEASCDELENTSEVFLNELGICAPVSVTLDKETYPTRHYDNFSLPAGIYNSLKVTINEGDGQNWWCIIFPSLCISDAVEAEEEYVEAGFTPEQYKIIENDSAPKYKVKFKILEIISDFLGLRR